MSLMALNGQGALFSAAPCARCGAAGYEAGHPGCYPLAAPTDPATSHEAAETIRAILPELHALTLWTLRRMGTPVTTHQAGRFCAADDPANRDAEWHRQRIGRRISGLRDRGLVKGVGSVREATTGLRCIQWALTPAGMAEATLERVHPILRGCPPSECAGCDLEVQAREMVMETQGRT